MLCACLGCVRGTAGLASLRRLHLGRCFGHEHGSRPRAERVAPPSQVRHRRGEGVGVRWAAQAAGALFAKGQARHLAVTYHILAGFLVVNSGVCGSQCA